MAEITTISWTRSTFNPWIGCTEVGPGCLRCYAKRMDARGIFGGETHWGPGVPRYRTSSANWNQVRSWNKLAAKRQAAGQDAFWPVFSASLADIFDNEVPSEWRADYWQLVKETPNLTYLVVTKRIGNAMRMLPSDWGSGYQNVWLISTIVNQEEANRDIGKLLNVPAVLHGLSMEPLLESVNLRTWLGIDRSSPNHPWEAGGFNQGIGWVIVGGESGAGAREMPPDLARGLRDQCKAADVPFFMKQLGGEKDKREDIAALPSDLQIREVPNVRR